MNIVNKQDGDKEIIDFAVDYLRQGKIIVYPTETVYGIGCEATNQRAVKRILKLKGSSGAKQLLVLVANLKMAKEYANFNSQAMRLAKSYWPGPLTLILTTTELGYQIFKTKTIGLRISSHELATALVKKSGKPLISTSANLAGEEPAQSGLEAAAIFSKTKDEPDMFLDAGKLRKSKGSTIVDCTQKDLKVLRQGDIKLKI